MARKLLASVLVWPDAGVPIPTHNASYISQETWYLQWGYLELDKGGTLGRKLSISQVQYNTPGMKGQKVGREYLKLNLQSSTSLFSDKTVPLEGARWPKTRNLNRATQLLLLVGCN